VNNGWKMGADHREFIDRATLDAAVPPWHRRFRAMSAGDEFSRDDLRAFDGSSPTTT
jgi:hypothetical protein